MRKKLFKPQRERHPIKRTLILLGLFMLSFASFSAGVQFAEMTQDGPQSQFAEDQSADEEGPTRAASSHRPLRPVRSPGEEV